MTRSDLERRLAEHFEPTAGLSFPVAVPRGGLGGRSPLGLWLHVPVLEPYWKPVKITRDGNAMLALVRAAQTAVGARVTIAPTHRTETSPWEGLYVVGAKANEAEWAWASPVCWEGWPLAVAVAVARAVGILGAGEEVTDG